MTGQCINAPATTSIQDSGYENKFRNLSRRVFFSKSGATLLSATAVALLAGCDTMAASTDSGSVEDDVNILNAAIGAELEAIAAYQLGAESGLLSSAVLPVAVKFQGHHKEHAELLASTVTKLGGTAETPRADYDFPVEKLKSEADVLAFAAELEKGAVSAYLGAVPLFTNRDLAKAAASILGDEAMHWAVLRSALGLDPVPAAFVS